MNKKKENPYKIRQDSLTTSVLRAAGAKIGANQYHTDFELFYQSNNLISRFIDYCPDRLNNQPPIFYFDNEDASKAMYMAIDNLECYLPYTSSTVPYTEFISQAFKLADLEGNAYILMGTDNGTLDTELDSAITYLCLFTYNHITEDTVNDQYRLNYSKDQEDKIQQQVVNYDIHPSRIFKLFGKKRLNKTNSHRDYSLLEPIIKHYNDFDELYCTIRYLIKTNSFFLFEKKNLDNIRAVRQEADLTERIQGLLAGIEEFGGLLTDQDKEGASVVTRNYGGLEGLIKQLEDFFIAQTGYPRSYILGHQQSSGLSNSSDYDDRRLASIVRNYQVGKYKPFLKTLAENIAEYNGLPSEIEITFESTYEPSAKEDAEIRKLNMEVRLLELQVEAAEKALLEPTPQPVNQPQEEQTP